MLSRRWYRRLWIDFVVTFAVIYCTLLIFTDMLLETELTKHQLKNCYLFYPLYTLMPVSARFIVYRLKGHWHWPVWFEFYWFDSKLSIMFAFLCIELPALSSSIVIFLWSEICLHSRYVVVFDWIVLFLCVAELICCLGLSS